MPNAPLTEVNNNYFVSGAMFFVEAVLTFMKRYVVNVKLADLHRLLCQTTTDVAKDHDLDTP
jgi:hypothetical protein